MKSTKTTPQSSFLTVREAEKEIRADFQGFRRIYEIEKTQHHNRISLAQLDSWIRTLEKTEVIIPRIEQFLRKGKIINQETGRRFGTGITLNLLKDARGFLSSIVTRSRLPNRGRLPEVLLGHCAAALANAFRDKTGNPHHKEVGRILADWFPAEGHAPYQEEELLRLWALRLEKSYSKGYPKTHADRLSASVLQDLIQQD